MFTYKSLVCEPTATILSWRTFTKPAGICPVNYIPPHILIRRLALYRVNAQEGARFGQIPPCPQMEQVGVTPIPLTRVPIRLHFLKLFVPSLPISIIAQKLNSGKIINEE